MAKSVTNSAASPRRRTDAARHACAVSAPAGKSVAAASKRHWGGRVMAQAQGAGSRIALLDLSTIRKQRPWAAQAHQALHGEESKRHPSIFQWVFPFGDISARSSVGRPLATGTAARKAFVSQDWFMPTWARQRNLLAPIIDVQRLGYSSLPGVSPTITRRPSSPAGRSGRQKGRYGLSPVVLRLHQISSTPSNFKESRPRSRQGLAADLEAARARWRSG